jgi:putative ABC transport system permease protein
MFDKDTWQEIWHTITQNRSRSVMTAFGVFWGIFMLVVLAGLGEGLERKMKETLLGTSPNVLYTFSSTTSVPYKGFKRGRAWSMTISDIDIIRRARPDILCIGAVATSYADDVSYQGRSQGLYLRGLDANFGRIDSVTVLSGRFINDIDVHERRKVCVVGKQVRDKLFAPGQDPVGALLMIQKVAYTVVGVVEAANHSVYVAGSHDDSIEMPISTFQETMHRGDKISLIAMRFADDTNIDEASKEVVSIIKEQHLISPDDEMAVVTFNLAEMVNTSRGFILALKALIYLVGIGTLLSGLIGICNIMIVSVRERTQEIGIRRALGAKPYQIIAQIMSESLILTFIAGIGGVMGGIGTLALVAKVIGNDNEMLRDPQLSFWTAVGSLAILIIGGLLAGLLPASYAVRIRAIEALREE